MDGKTIVNPNPTTMSTSGSGFPKKHSLRPGKPGRALPDAELLGFPVETGGDATRTEATTGGSLPKGGAPPNSRESMQVNTEARVSSIQECALSDTLKAVRGLRDEYFLNEADSRPGLLLAQVAFILERIEHGIPSGRETFLAVVRAARLPEPTTEAAEVTV